MWQSGKRLFFFFLFFFLGRVWTKKNLFWYFKKHFAGFYIFSSTRKTGKYTDKGPLPLLPHTHLQVPLPLLCSLVFSIHSSWWLPCVHALRVLLSEVGCWRQEDRTHGKGWSSGMIGLIYGREQASLEFREPIRECECGEGSWVQTIGWGGGRV